MTKKILSAAAALFAIICTSSSVSADQIFSFARVTSTANPQAPDDQFSVRVLGSNDSAALASYGGGILAGQILFVFQNNVGMDSSLTDVYFQGSTLQQIDAIRQSAGVSFGHPASPANLPSGNSLNPAFTTPSGFSADSNNANNGVDSASEWVGVLFALKSTKTYDDVINAVHNWNYDASMPLADRWSTDSGPDSLRFGIHVSSIGAASSSDSYVSIPDREFHEQLATPEPSSLVLLSIGGVTGLFGAVRARRRRVSA